jgi:hypothetical protein
MPKDITSLGVAKRNQKNLAVALQRAVQIPELSIDLSNNHIGAHILGNIAQERSGGSLVGLGGDGGGVAVANVEGNVDFGVRAVLGLLEMLLPKLLEEIVTLDQPLRQAIGSRGALRFGVLWRGSGGLRSALSLVNSSVNSSDGQIPGGVRSHGEIPRSDREIDR